jgi:hypothetical protein
MTVRVLFFADCPNAAAAVQLVRSVISDLAPTIPDDVVVDLHEVRDLKEAQEQGFLGSPSVQIDGVDIEVPRRGDQPAFACRVYRDGPRLSPTPPREMVAAAFRSAAAASARQRT